VSVSGQGPNFDLTGQAKSCFPEKVMVKV